MTHEEQTNDLIYGTPRDYADIHSCSYSCQRPGCIERQRKELAGYAHDIYQAVTVLEPNHRMTFQGVMKYAAERLKELA